MTEEEWHAEAMRLVDNNSMAYFGFTRTGDKDKAETARDALAAHLRNRPDDAALTVLRELVELKDFKDRYAMSVPDSPRSPHWREYQDGLANYERRKPLAWAAARALADKEQKS